MRNVADKFAEKVKTRILCAIKFSENFAACGIMWKKYGRAGQATDDHTAPTLFMLDKKAIDRHAHRIRNVYCFSTATELSERASMLRLDVRCVLL
jgi:hypothetical protein